MKQEYPSAVVAESKRKLREKSIKNAVAPRKIKI